MQRALTVARLADIPVDIQLSWPPVFLFVTWFLAETFFPRVYPRHSVESYWSLGLIASFLLFCSLLAHELGHAVVARRRGLVVYRVSLFVLGGLVELDLDDCIAADELLVALAGPAVSLVLGVSFAAMSLVARPGSLVFSGLVMYLASCNILLAGFNLLPGLPLDGGRVVRAGLWRLLGSQAQATSYARWLGQVLAGLSLVGGVALALSGSWMIGFWLAAVGVFLVGSDWSGYIPSPH